MKRAIAIATLLCAALVASAGVKPHKPSNPPNPVVNINTATEAELELLPGVGPKLATAIYTFAEAGGVGKGDPKCDHRCHFKTVDDLLKVEGIGAKKLDALRPYVVTSGQTTAVAKIKAAKMEESGQ